MGNSKPNNKGIQTSKSLLSHIIRLHLSESNNQNIFIMGTFSSINDLDLSTGSIGNGNTTNTGGQGTGSGANGNPAGQGQQGAGQEGQQGQGGSADTSTVDNGGENQQGQQGQGEGQQGSSSTGEEVVLSEGDTVNVDGVDYTIDANGNALAADGTVFRTAAELAELISQNGSEPSILEQLQTSFGSDFKDENGNPIVFDDNEEGIAAYVETVVQSRVKEAQAAAINNLFETYPQVEQVINHLKLNGSLDVQSER